MSSPTAPTTLDNPAQPSVPAFRRSFTTPARISNAPRSSSPASSGSSDGIETLFTHTFAKVVSFTASSSITRPVSSARRGSAEVSLDTPGSIPWRSYTERTLAAGPLRIYRVTSSNVSFLNSGSLLHTIFPKSQCWCVDGESKFVLRIRQDSYYRIELPYDSTEDKEKVEEFKTVLARVLQYERTQCPFRIGSEVELPEPPKTPVRKRPRKPAEKAKKWLFDKTWVPEDGPRPILESSDSGTASPYEEDDRESVKTDSTNEETEENIETPMSTFEVTPPQPPPQVVSVSERVKRFQSARSVTAPPEMILGLSSKSETQESPEMASLIEQKSDDASADSISVISSTDTFYSMGKTISRSPTPPFMDAASMVDENPWAHEGASQEVEQEEGAQAVPRGRGQHRRQISEITIRPHSEDEGAGELSPRTPTNNIQLSSAPSTPPLMSDSDDSIEPPFLDVPTPPDTIRLRKLTGATQRRAYSPMPHPQNLFSPPAHAPRKQFTAALVRKTAELILGPPAHLVTLMLRIAARISNGTFGFSTYQVHHTGERIPCSWESSGDEDEWGEDDYGIPLGNLSQEGSTLRRREMSSAYEVD